MKTKRSFFEKITGAREVDENEPKSMNIFSEESESELTMPTMRSNSPSFAQPEETWGMSASSASATDAEGQLTIDVYQTDNDVVIKSTIAGVKPEDLDVSINNDMVTIRGERKNEEEVVSENYYYQECYWGSFSRSVVMPVDIIPEKAEASLKNGILTIRLPKAATNKVKKIQVRGF